MSSPTALNKTPPVEERKSGQALLQREQAYLADLREFADDLASLRYDQDRVATAAERLEARMIDILSFSTAVEMFARFLIERERHAELVLAEPLDDIDDLQDLVAIAENTLSDIHIVPSKVNDNLQNANIQEHTAIELLESRNIARRIQLQLQERLQSKTSNVKVARVHF
jgi:hypothetical protein